MSAKSIHEADGKALLAYFLPRSPALTKESSATSFVPAPPRLASLTFPDDSTATVTAVLDAAEATYPWLLVDGARFVAKPDQLIKRRGKSGLLSLNVTWSEARAWVAARAGKQIAVEGINGYLRTFLVEPFVAHAQENEYYININSVREGDWILFYHEGGVDVGDVDAKASKILIPVDLESEYPSNATIISTLLSKVPESQHATLVDFINRLYAAYVDLQFTYLEINPLVVIPTASGVEVHYLDLAAKLDQTAEFECGAKWAIARSPTALGITAPTTGSVINIDAGPPMVFPAPFGRELTTEEAYIAELDSKTGASLKLTVLNPAGRVWTLVAGGGASVVYADAIASAGYANDIANYGEYSGAPSETQTYEYAKTVLDLMTRGSPVEGGKVLFIGGGIANFTQVGSTFKGIIRAFKDYQALLHTHGVRMYVRRGGPNWQEGLRLIKNCSEELAIPMEVYGPDMHVSGIVPLALLDKRPVGISAFGTSGTISVM
ncbi:uncharacterized protein V2V93DRAFT_321257 [Kockiozyma suomiensis]|uniref:uncharacterized protein n=1 Tax=Kockiozyma suomiensis TaxID=1337062 RepID=UPI0033432F37